MAESNFRGPVNSMGAMEIEGGTTATIEPMDGPSLFYQGAGLPDVRNQFLKDGTGPSRQGAFLGVPSLTVVDSVPQTFSSTVLAASQVATALTPMALATVGLTNPTPASQFIANGVPIRPQGTTNVTTANIALDFGFTTGTTTANNTSVQVPDSTKFSVGQWIVIGNVANAAATSSLITQVVAISSTNFTTITVANAPATGMCAPIGAAGLFGSGLLPPATQFGPSAPVATFHEPNLAAGFAKMHNPAEALARGISISVASAAATTGFLVTGWDYWRQLMTELIQVPITTGATTIYGKKAFKYVQSVVPQQSQTAVSVGISDVFGLPLRADLYEYCTVFAGSTSVVNNVGFLGAVSTTAGTTGATNTTGDVRGTWQISGIGSGAGLTAPATTNGALRLTIIQDLGTWNQLAATPLNTVPLFGIAQSTT